MEYKLLNVYETSHSLYTKCCSLAVYETLVTPIDSAIIYSIESTVYHLSIYVYKLYSDV